MLTFLIVVLAAAVYLKVGYEIGDRSVEVWLDKDNESWVSFLLFPASHRKGVVGKNDGSMIDSMGDSSKGSDLFAKLQRSSNGTSEATGYKIINSLFWPLRLALFNLPSYILLGPGQLLKRFSQWRENGSWRKVKKAVDRAVSERIPEKMRRLLKEQAELDESFRQLMVELQRRRLDNEHQLQMLLLDPVSAIEEQMESAPDQPLPTGEKSKAG